ncbi:WW domain-containing oxidoreductase [Lasiodiplodia hormozganensis]|uniref:WW domain-containing oxidoreductase n=1 Tax=Lasiodiplodia hormozganensis TaxID=869390 RepID=A0AA39WHD8_9PEZI|nr:WW domain-containing oxidoreductase [Lasiodiplodia hormozganensis]
MSGTVIVTGAAGGLGFALAESIVNRPEADTCIFTVRNQSAANAKPLHTLRESTQGKTVELHELDLSKADAVRTFAAAINTKVSNKQLPPIRALILNAAAIPMMGPRQLINWNDAGDLEMMFAVNHVANFLLTLLLLPSLDPEHGRIVLISSDAHRMEKLEWNLEEISRGEQVPGAGDKWNDVMRRYGMSKLCQVMFMHELQERIDADPRLNKICVLAVSPGAMIHPNIMNKMNPFMKYVVGPVATGVFKAVSRVNPDGVMRTVEKSAAHVQRAALDAEDPELGRYPKDLYLDGAKIVKPLAESFDKAKQKELWDFSVKLAGLTGQRIL